MKNLIKFCPPKLVCKIIIFAATILTIFNVVPAFATSTELPEIYIKAINPGYTVDGTSNVGEMIEISYRDHNPDDPSTSISLANLSISYTNSSGNTVTLAEFPENFYLVGEKVFLLLASSPYRELAARTYTKTLAFKAGPLVLKRGDEILDSVCWTGAEGCYAAFNSKNPTTLVRNLETGEFEHITNYEPDYAAGTNFYIKNDETETPETTTEKPSKCKGIVFSEILSYYAEKSDEQFIEFYNSTTEQIFLDGCQIRYKNKLYPLTGLIKPDEYFARYLTDFNLTKNPTTKNLIELIDANDEAIDKIEYGGGQRKGTSYAWLGYDENGEDLWKVTYDITPGSANVYQEYKTCEAGKVINVTTGNCVKVTTVAEKICGEGQYLNILTGRCKKVETETVKTCNEGYYLNPDTNRCKKITENTGADYFVKAEEYEESSSFIALYAVAGVGGIAGIYLIYEFRRDLARLARKVFAKFRR